MTGRRGAGMRNAGLLLAAGLLIAGVGGVTDRASGQNQEQKQPGSELPNAAADECPVSS